LKGGKEDKQYRRRKKKSRREREKDYPEKDEKKKRLQQGLQGLRTPRDHSKKGETFCKQKDGGVRNGGRTTQVVRMGGKKPKKFSLGERKGSVDYSAIRGSAFVAVGVGVDESGKYGELFCE